ncbi:MAG: ParA family protein [Oscillospiraceae bacterium]|nr:ParA family protein [Oscillospiraceae bacterium]
MRVITVASQKGGTGKTTTSSAITSWAVSHGMKSLAIDLDPQGSLTCIMRGNGNALSSYELMKGTSAGKVIQAGTGENMPDIIPASLQLAAADAEYSTRPGRDFLLKKAIEPLHQHYDLVVIDTPPTLGTLLINALSAATEVIIPVQVDTFALQSIYQLMETISQVKEYCNSGLTVSGVLLTRYNGRAILTRDLRERLEQVCGDLGVPLFSTAISEGIATKEAQTLRESLFTYAPKSKPAQDYAALMGELEIGGCYVGKAV